MNGWALISVNVPAREIGFLGSLDFFQGMREELIIAAALALVVGAIFIWAVYLRPKGRRHKHHHHHHHHHRKIEPVKPAGAVSAQNNQPIAPAAETKGRRRRRRRQSDHVERTINPTLAQSGGLPPLRDEETPPRGL